MRTSHLEELMSRVWDDEVREMYLTTMTRAQCEKIHEAALHILEHTGTIFESHEALELLQKAGAKVDGQRVFFPHSLVEWALETVPRKFALYDQNGDFCSDVGGWKCLYGTGSDCLNILDHRTGVRRDPLTADLQELVSICDRLEHIDFIMSMVIPTDFPRSVADRLQMETILEYSSKPVIAVSFSFEGTKDIIQMAEIAAGGEESLRNKPFMVHYIQPVRALFHNRDTVEKLLYTAKKGIPCVYLTSAIIGMTSPITSAGYQAMGAAGQLAALTLAQLVREGTPIVVRGGRVPMVDMKTMLALFADPANRIFSAEMAHFYDLPTFGCAGVSDSKLMDWQAVAEGSLTLLADSLIGGNLIHDVGYIESGVTFSAEMLVFCDEVISWIKSFVSGMPINEETLALELIDNLGLDGDFLPTQHTFRHFREQWSPTIFDRKVYPNWQKTGGYDAREKVHQKIDKILENHKGGLLPETARSEIKAVTKRARDEADENG
jgi:trimethylamine--corrinoid protein Co-methyltransferase